MLYLLHKYIEQSSLPMFHAVEHHAEELGSDLYHSQTLLLPSGVTCISNAFLIPVFPYIGFISHLHEHSIRHIKETTPCWGNGVSK